MNGNSDQKVNGKSVQRGFVRIPRTVLHDVKLSYAARCVYGVLSGTVWEGNTAKMGQRKIARMIGASQETVLLALRELEERKHLSIVGLGKERRAYVLNSDVFGQKQGKVDIVRGGRYVSLDHGARGIAKSGTA